MAAKILLPLVALVFAGCGGGGSDTHSIAAAAATCAPLAQVRVQLFGDSTMAGYDGAGGAVSLAVHTPAVALQAALDARFGIGATLVTSRAVGGTTAVQLVAGTDGLNQPWPRSVAADIVVVNHGINDLTHNADLPGYRAALATIAANTAGARLIFETPNRVQGHDLAPYAQAMRDAAAGPVADTFLLPDGVILRGDWAHPTDAGYQNIVAQSLAPAVVPVVGALRCDQAFR